MKDKTEKQLLNARDAARIFGISEPTFRKLVYGAGFGGLNMKAVKVGNHNYWKRSDVLAALGLSQAFKPQIGTPVAMGLPDDDRASGIARVHVAKLPPPLKPTSNLEEM
jgi:hypothetical protein